MNSIKSIIVECSYTYMYTAEPLYSGHCGWDSRHCPHYQRGVFNSECPLYRFCRMHYRSQPDFLCYAYYADLYTHVYTCTTHTHKLNTIYLHIAIITTLMNVQTCMGKYHSCTHSVLKMWLQAVWKSPLCCTQRGSAPAEVIPVGQSVVQISYTAHTSYVTIDQPIYDVTG